MISGLWQGRNEDLEREINKLQQKEQKLEEDKNQVAEQYKEEYMQLKTDRDATITQLKGPLYPVLFLLLWMDGYWLYSLQIWLSFA